MAETNGAAMPGEPLRMLDPAVALETSDGQEAMGTIELVAEDVGQRHDAI